MTDIAGNVNYYVRLSTAQSSGPSGNILYLYAEDYNKSFKDGMMSKQSVGGRSYRYPNGKRAISVDLKNCYITAQQTASATSELAAIENFFYTYSNKSGASPIYLFIKNMADNEDVKLAHYSGTHQIYLKCYVDSYSLKGGKGKLYIINTLKLIEATN